jgi:hypothetical protein
MMSALQQSPICGLEEPEFPYRSDTCQGHRAADKARQTGGVIPWRLARTLPSPADLRLLRRRLGKISNREQDGA